MANQNTILATDFEHKGKIYDTSLDIGIVSGSFSPFHKGHMALVDAAKQRNNIVIVVVAGYDKDRGALCNMPLKFRYQRLREQYKNDNQVYVAMLDEKKDKPFDDPQGLQDYKESVEEIISIYCPNLDCDSTYIHNYVGDKWYKAVLDNAYPDWYNMFWDRFDKANNPYSMVNATSIRANPYGNWDDIAPSFKCVWRKVILFAGSMSTGKTTFTKKFAEYYDGIAVEETARFYTEGWRHTIESDLNHRDYLAFIEDQLAALEEAKMRCSDEKYVFADTDGFVTQLYLEWDKECVNPIYKDALITVCDMSCVWTARNVDHVIFLPCDTEYVMDGSRDGHFDEFRESFSQELYHKYVEEANCDVTLIKSGSFKDKEQAINNVFRVHIKF